MTRDEILTVSKPILFNTEMVQAILDGRKTATRRVMKPQPTAEAPVYCYAGSHKHDIGCWHDESGHRWKPPYHAGDYLYVRETWWKNYGHEYGMYFYRADDEEIQMPLITGGTAPHRKADGLKWRPSIHMPKEAARLFLRVAGVRVERLQNITSMDIGNEGIDLTDLEPLGVVRRGEYEFAFSNLWNSTIKPAELPLYGWEANPWVWVIHFEREEAN